MQKFNGYEDAQKNAQYTGSAKLPVGAYICKILGVKYISGENDNSDMIQLSFDVDDGEFKGFFQNQYDANTAEDKKWKGKTTIYVPKDDGSDKDQWTKNSFAKWTNAFEDSNDKYSWDWDENKWKGLKVGIVFGETGTVIEGKEIVYTEARFACSVKQIKDGKAPTAKFKAKNGYGNKTSVSADFVNVTSTEESLPWD